MSSDGSEVQVGTRVRQAVVIVHGIGQQRPLATMHGYVDALTGDHDLTFGAPDEISGFHDLRRMKVTWLPQIELVSTAEGLDGIPPPLNTDFYELYWANLVQGTELRHVVGWFISLIPRWRQIAGRFKGFLRYHALHALMILVAAIVVFAVSWTFFTGYPLLGTVLRWIAGLAGTAALSWVVWHLGDVPRYMHDVADNVTIQRDVRRQGVELLRRLHQKTYPGSDLPLYERIIVVGHSLGTVVAYDIVRDYWAEVYRNYAIDPTLKKHPLTRAATGVDVEGEASWRRGPEGPWRRDRGFTAFQARQRRLQAEMAIYGGSLPPGATEYQRWAITDLVTLASPLTHADFLLRSSKSEVEEAQWSRQLASCPPRRQMAKPSYRFKYIHGPRKDLESWHQAAAFAATRWTNVYFQADVVGGPLQPLFGPGIVDIELANPSGLAGHMPRVHSQYAVDPAAIAVLQRVIWDGGRRASVTTLNDLLVQSLGHALREILSRRGRRLTVREAVAGSRLLDRLTPGQKARVASMLEGAGPEDLAALVQELASDISLLHAVRVLDTLLPSSLDEGLEGEEVEEAQAEEEAPQEEEE